MPEKERHKVLKTLMLCMYSNIFGYDNINQVLTAYGIKSTNFYRLYEKLSFTELTNLSAGLFAAYISEPLLELGKQSASSWSPVKATYIIGNYLDRNTDYTDYADFHGKIIKDI